jgi:hypothetical protein
MLTGGCQCGRVRYETDGVPFHETLCHCVDCRRVTGAPAVAWFSVRTAQLRFVSGAPRRFASSERAMRGFCPDCGTALTFQYNAMPDEIDVTIASLDDPEAVRPLDQLWTRSRPSWMERAAELPAYRTTRKAG